MVYVRITRYSEKVAGAITSSGTPQTIQRRQRRQRRSQRMRHKCRQHHQQR
jgi:hypothetical protein